MASRAALCTSTRTIATRGRRDTIRGGQYTIPITITDPGPDNNLATTDDNQTIQTFDRPAGLAQDRVFSNVPDADSSFHTIEFAVNRRFANNRMVLTSFGYTWSNMLHDVTGYQRLLGQAAATANQNFLPVRRLYGDNGLETSTIYNYKAIGRYVAKWDIGMSGSWKYQSGENYGRTLTFTFLNHARIRRADRRAGSRTSRSSTSASTSRSGSARWASSPASSTSSTSSTPASRRTSVRRRANFLEVTELLAPRVMRFGRPRYDF